MPQTAICIYFRVVGGSTWYNASCNNSSTCTVVPDSTGGFRLAVWTPACAYSTVTIKGAFLTGS
jgi:hypothetical protein